MDRDCASCGTTFVAKRSTALYCSATCRQRAARERKAAADNTAAEAKTDTPAEHGLVKAVRKELAEADALDTVAGQLALQIARRIADPEGAGVSTLSKELRSLLAEATGGRPVPEPKGDAAEPDEDDEVTKARRAREDKLRQAAGRA